MNGMANALFWMLVGALFLMLVEGWAHSRIERARKERIREAYRQDRRSRS